MTNQTENVLTSVIITFGIILCFASLVAGITYYNVEEFKHNQKMAEIGYEQVRDGMGILWKRGGD